MSVFEMAQRYYPRLWDKARLEDLVEAGRLTEEEFREITGDGITVGGIYSVLAQTDEKEEIMHE